MLADETRQRQQVERHLQVHGVQFDAFRDRRARRFRVFLGGFAALDVGAETARAQLDRFAVVVMAQQLAVRSGDIAALDLTGQRPGVAAFRVIGTPDEGAA